MPLLRDCTRSKRINCLSDGAEVLFYRLLMRADDFGNFTANPALIKAECFPLKENIRTANIVRWLNELSSLPSDERSNETSTKRTALIRMYEVNGDPLLHIFDFGQKHKYPKRKFPPPEIEVEAEIEVEEETEKRNAASREHPSIDLKLRKENFAESLKPFAAKYGREMMNEFFRYWTESNEGGKKMRFEMEKVFEISRRLGTWKRNEAKFSKKPFGANGSMPDQWDVNYYKKLDGPAMANYFRHLREKGLVAKKDRIGNIIDFVPAQNLQANA